MSTYESPICTFCGIRKCSMAGYRKKDGSPGFKNKCEKCRGQGKYGKNAEKIRRNRNPWTKVAMERKLALMSCEVCDFKALHPIQLDIDHLDGNKKNNDPSNLKITCANCHRYKTWVNKEYGSMEYRDSIKDSKGYS